jgi:hypothetical protein
MTFFDATSNDDERIASNDDTYSIKCWYPKSNQNQLAREAFIIRMPDYFPVSCCYKN